MDWQPKGSRVLGRSHDQFAFEDTLEAAKLGGDVPQAFGRAPKDDYLEAEIVLQVGVQHRNDQVRVVVLQVHQLVTKLRPMVIVDQGECAGHLVRARFPSLMRQLVANELANRLAPRGKLLLLAIAVELIQEIILDGYREPYNFAHRLNSHPDRAEADITVLIFTLGESRVNGAGARVGEAWRPPGIMIRTPSPELAHLPSRGHRSRFESAEENARHPPIVGTLCGTDTDFPSIWIVLLE